MNSNEWKVKWEIIVILMVVTLVFAICMHIL